MYADVRIDPDGTTWIRIDSHGQAYWYNRELLDAAGGPASDVPFTVEPEPAIRFHMYSPTVSARWHIPAAWSTGTA